MRCDAMQCNDRRGSLTCQNDDEDDDVDDYAQESDEVDSDSIARLPISSPNLHEAMSLPLLSLAIVDLSSRPW